MNACIFNLTVATVARHVRLQKLSGARAADSQSSSGCDVTLILEHDSVV